MSKVKLLVMLGVLIISTFLLTSAAFAQGNGPYIQINNGDIVTNHGQQPQVVVQFGNRGNAIVENVDVTCVWSGELGFPGAVYPGPFTFFQTFDAIPLDIAEFGADLVAGVLIDDVDLIPGQNYNVAFDIHITAPSGTEGFVQCGLFTNFFNLIALTPAIPVRVQ
jgi:hypothetical protein